MANLFDTIKKKVTAAPAPVSSSAQSQISKVLAAKAGKAGAGGGGPQASSLGEQAAIGEANATAAGQALKGAEMAANIGQAVQNLGTQATVQQQQLDATKRMAQAGMANAGAIQRQQVQANEQMAKQRSQANERMNVEKINNTASRELKKLAAQKQMDLNNIFDEFERSNRDLEFRQDAAELEQLGFLMAMQDQAYVQEITRIGEERQLRTDLNFQKELSDMVWGEEFQMFMDKLGFKSVYAQNDRELKLELANMDASTAMDMARALISSSNQQAVAGGLTTVAREGIDYMVKDKPVTPSTGSSGSGPGGPATPSKVIT